MDIESLQYDRLLSHYLEKEQSEEMPPAKKATPMGVQQYS